MEQEHVRTEDKIRRVLFNEVSFVIALIAAVSSAIFWVSGPQNDLKLDVVKLQTQLESNETVTAELAKIKNNDLHEVQLRLDRIEERQLENIKALSRIEALLKTK